MTIAPARTTDPQSIPGGVVGPSDHVGRSRSRSGPVADEARRDGEERHLELVAAEEPLRPDHRRNRVQHHRRDQERRQRGQQAGRAATARRRARTGRRRWPSRRPPVAERGRRTRPCRAGHRRRTSRTASARRGPANVSPDDEAQQQDPVLPLGSSPGSAGGGSATRWTTAVQSILDIVESPGLHGDAPATQQEADPELPGERRLRPPRRPHGRAAACARAGGRRRRDRSARSSRRACARRAPPTPRRSRRAARGSRR